MKKGEIIFLRTNIIFSHFLSAFACPVAPADGTGAPLFTPLNPFLSLFNRGVRQLICENLRLPS